ncbi:DNA-binding protein, partial [Pseudomonas lundensis]|nr:DNA-binding protein [Pseudomonas lundensis]
MSNDPSITLDAVDQMSAYWDVITPLMGGTLVMRAAQALLPKYPAEDDEVYKERLRLSTLLPAYSETVGNMTSRVFAEP